MTTITNILDCEKYLTDVDAVIFDLDDTLYSEKEYVKSGFAAVACQFPQIKQMEKRLWNAFEQKHAAIDWVLGEEGISDPEYIAKALQTYRCHKPNISLYKGVEALLLRLKERKKLGLITDGRPEGQRAKLEALNISGHFERIIVTDELGGVQYRKPNEAAFVMMQQTMNVPFDRMMYIGDNLAKDFVAPQKLGMKGCYFANPDGLYTDMK